MFFAVAVMVCPDIWISQLSVTSTPSLRTVTAACEASRAASSVSVMMIESARLLSATWGNVWVMSKEAVSPRLLICRGGDLTGSVHSG